MTGFQTAVSRLSALGFNRRKAGARPAPHGGAPGRAAPDDGLIPHIREAAAGVSGLVEALADETVCEPLGVRQSRAVQALVEAARRLTALTGELGPPPVGNDCETDRLDPVHALNDAVLRSAPTLDRLGVRVMIPAPLPGLGVRTPSAGLTDLFPRLLEQAATLCGPGGAVMAEVHQDKTVSIMLRMLGDTPLEARLAEALRAGGDLDRIRRRAGRLGGDLRVESSPETGARLILELPGAGGPPRVAGAVTAPAPDLSDLRLLVVGAEGPDRTLIRLLGGALNLGGLYLAPDMPSGLAMIHDLKPDVVILDAASPHGDPASLARTLDRDPAPGGPRRLALLPAAPRPGLTRQLRELGFRRLLARPLDIGDLAFALKTSA